MEAKLLSETDAQVELIGGKGGIFDVHADGKLIYCKRESNNEFPEESAIVDALNALKN